MDLGLKGKVAAVTGGSEGVGYATALSLAREGANVSICARRKEVLEEAAERIRRETGGEVLAVQADVTRAEDCERFIRATVERFGRLDILVNNAGRAAARPFERVGDDEWADDLNLKLFAAIRCSRAAVPHMRAAGGGRIINITHPGGKTPGAGSLPSSVSRAAGIALAKAMSKDLARDGILVNTVCLSNIRTAQTERSWRASGGGMTFEEYCREQGRKVPVGRLGEPAEVGDLIAFLVSERGAFITGTSINIDGGAASAV